MSASAPALQKFLERLVDPAKSAIPAYHLAIVVAHPQDAVLFCGATLARLKGAHIIITGGSSPGDDDVPGYAFPESQSRAIGRWCSLSAASELAGVRACALIN